MWNIEVYSNDVNGTGANSEGVASGRCPVEQQHRPVILLLLKDNWRDWHVLPWSCGKCYVSKRDCCWELAENSQKKNWRGSHHNNKHYPHPLPLQEKKRKLETRAQFLNNNAVLTTHWKCQCWYSYQHYNIWNSKWSLHFYLCYCYTYTYCTLLCCCWCFWTRQGILKIQTSAAYPSITLRVNVDDIMSTMIISCYWEDTAHCHYSKLLLNELWSSL